MEAAVCEDDRGTPEEPAAHRARVEAVIEAVRAGDYALDPDATADALIGPGLR